MRTGSNIARSRVTAKVIKMRHVILALILVGLSVVATRSTVVFPRIQYIEFETPVVIRSTLCDKYDRLFMEAMHKSLECSEDFSPHPDKLERCERLSRQLTDYSYLRSLHCYGEREDQDPDGHGC